MMFGGGGGGGFGGPGGAQASAANGLHHIETVWGRGYVLRDPHEGSVAAA